MVTAELNTLYYYCNDVEATRDFYTGLLGLEQTYFRNDDSAGWYTIVIGGVNVVFVRSTARIPEAIGFARQAGFEGGQVETHSWVLEVPPAEFEAVVRRLREAGVPSLTAEPLEPQPGHRQYIVQDPMGFTVEVYCAAAAMP